MSQKRIALITGSARGISKAITEKADRRDALSSSPTLTNRPRAKRPSNSPPATQTGPLPCKST